MLLLNMRPSPLILTMKVFCLAFSWWELCVYLSGYTFPVDLSYFPIKAICILEGLYASTGHHELPPGDLLVAERMKYQHMLKIPTERIWKGEFSLFKYRIKFILCTHDICIWGKQFRTARLRKVMGPLHQWLLEPESYSVFTDLQTPLLFELCPCCGSALEVPLLPGTPSVLWPEAPWSGWLASSSQFSRGRLPIWGLILCCYLVIDSGSL